MSLTNCFNDKFEKFLIIRYTMSESEFVVTNSPPVDETREVINAHATA